MCACAFADVHPLGSASFAARGRKIKEVLSNTLILSSPRRIAVVASRGELLVKGKGIELTAKLALSLS